MKKRPTISQNNTSAAHDSHFTLSACEFRFTGTNNPRHLRAIAALLQRSIWREELDSFVGCSNAPELIAALRRRGLEIPCVRECRVDRDGKLTRPGRYLLSQLDIRWLSEWQVRCSESNKLNELEM